MTPSLEGLPTKTKKTPSPHEVRLALLDTNPLFQCLLFTALSQTTSSSVLLSSLGQTAVLKIKQIFKISKMIFPTSTTLLNGLLSSIKHHETVAQIKPRFFELLQLCHFFNNIYNVFQWC